jgi:hypothetical protein
MQLTGICRSLGVTSWRPVRPWRIELSGVGVRESKNAIEQTLVWETAAGTLTSRWTLGPDGDWWQSEYPVKRSTDLRAARMVAEARRYELGTWPGHEVPAQASSDEIAAVELPQRPWSELFHTFLGWSEGLVLFLEEPDGLRDVVKILEEKLARLVAEIRRLPEPTVVSPDNLDGQFIAPAAFEEMLAPSYRKSVEMLRACGKRLVVHVGGPVRRLLPGLADCGIDCVEGVCGPPQGDSPLAEARGLSGARMALWGGIPQDSLLASFPESGFREAAEAAFSMARADPGVIVGVADRVPVSALPERLEALARMSLEI